ncbi:MAG: choice-of-anchor L domain-containing protein [Flavobacteriales bacterium]
MNKLFALQQGIRTGLIAGLVLFSTTASAQLTVASQTNLQQLAEAITGSGVQITNPTINCHTEGYGEFSYTGNLLGADEGVLLTSGRITEAIGPNNVENKSFQQGTPGSAELNTVTGRTTYDACRFEFDIIPSGDSLKFDFVLGSEEYNEWVGSQYNDVFGFFISGPGITGDAGIGNDHNIALIPGTTQAVTINNVNNGAHQAYYYDNAGGAHIQYDGFTKNLSARSVVQPCQTYHLKLIVADASDRKFDSGVFIEKIVSNHVTMVSHTLNGTPDMVEGCNTGWVTFTRSNVMATPLTLQYYLEGTTTNGTDYTAIGNVNPAVPKTIVIPANQASVDLPIDPLADGLNEGSEYLRFILGNPFCTGAVLDTLIFNIADTLIATVSPGTTTICTGGSMQFQVTGGANYAWSPATGLNSTTVANPIASPAVNTNYTVTITDGTCTRTVNRLVRVSDPVLSAVVTRPLCAGQSNGAVNITVSGAYAPFGFAWTGPGGSTATTEDLVNVPTGTYTLVFTDAGGCVRNQSFNVGTPADLTLGLTPSILAFGQNVACSGGATGTLALTINGGTGPYTQSWSGPGGFTSTAQNIGSLIAGPYAVSVVDANGCSAGSSYTLTESTPLAPSINGVVQVLCAGNNIGSANASVSGGMPPYAYSWNSTPAQSGATASGLGAGSYTVTVTDGYGCTTTANAMIPGPTVALSSAIGAQTNVNCFGANTGSATVSATGGTAPYSFSWNSLPAQSSATVNNLPAGTWTCTITDANGCSTTRPVTITQPAAALASSISAQVNVNCFGATTGSATVSATGGTAPYSFSWNTVPAQSGATAINLPAGAWTCTITDANACSITSTATITQPATALGSSITTQANVNCFEANTGSATVSATGGTAPYSFSWNTVPAQNGATASNLAVGAWTCTITDANGCSTTRPVTITQPAAALASSISAQVNANCFGAATGSATVSATGGTAPYSFNWNTVPAQSGAAAINLAAGTWTCTVVDANGCSTTSTVIITQPITALGSSITAQTNINCFGANTGGATVTATGGTAPYSFSWNTVPVQNGATASNLAVGTWTCTITDANGCSTTRPVTITQPAAALASSITAQVNVNCFGAATGSATVSATGGTAPYSFSWNTVPAQSGAVASNLAAGTWTCTIIDANGCSTTSTVIITQPITALGSSITAQTDINCFGANTGSATVSATGGIAPYSFSWNTVPVQNGATASNLPAGTWTCTVTDANGCSTDHPVIITQPVAALGSNISAQTNVNCFGATTGSATVSATGGTTPYSFSWNTVPAQSGATANNLSAGTWTCTVVDANGCSTTRPGTITQPAAALGSSITAQANVNCFGATTGNATVSATGGTAPYSFSWNTVPVQSGATASNLAVGTWTCTIIDANGCTTASTVTITQPAAALSSSVSAQSNVNCFGATTGSAIVNATGGTAPYTFSWNTIPAQGGTTANNLPAGTWTCTVVDANGCSTMSSVTITEPSATLAIIGVILPATCGGSANGAVNATVSGGTTPYTIAWSGPGGFSANSEDISNVSAGVYTLGVTDALGCSTSQTFNVNQPGMFNISGIVSNHNGFGASCITTSDGAIDQTISGGTSPYTHAWTGPGGFIANTVDVNGLPLGTYTYAITDANGCSFTASYTITAPSAITPVLSSASVNGGWNIGCNGNSTGSIAVSTSGGVTPYAFTWNGPGGFSASTASISSLEAGNYALLVTDANSCSTTVSIDLTEPAVLSAVGDVLSNVDCFGNNDGSASALASGGTAPYGYSWNTSPVQTNDTAFGLTASTWTCTIMDTNGCQTTADAIVDAPASPLSVAVTGFTNVLCFGDTQGTADALASGGTAPYAYSWNSAPSQSGASATDLPQGSYTVTASDAHGCTASDDVSIGGPQFGLFGFFEQVTNVHCFGDNDGEATINVSGGSNSYTITWNTQPPINGPTATGLAPGLYTVSVLDNNGCDTEKFYSLTITGPQSPLQLSLAVTPISCPGANDGAVDLTMTGGAAPYTHTWSGSVGGSTGLEDLVALDADIYSLHAYDVRGCVIDTAFTLAEPTPVIIAGNVTTADCQGTASGAVDLGISGGSAPYTYAWIGPNGFIASSEDIDQLIAGSYDVSVSDAHGCIQNTSFDVSQPGSLQVTSTPSAFNGGAAVSCDQASDGAIALDVTGGTVPYTFAWSGPNSFSSTAEDLSGLAAGAYNVITTDANGCSTLSNVDLQAPAPVDANLSVSNYNGSNVSCAGVNDGMIAIAVNGGAGPYTYNWSGPGGFTASTDSISGLAIGDYTVDVLDANGCATSAAMTFIAATPIDMDLTASAFNGGGNVSCAGASDGGVDLNVNGGAQPYSFAWTDGLGFTANSEDISGISAGAYQVIVTDANGCIASDLISLVNPQPIDLSATLSSINGNNVSCSGASDGSIDLSVSGGAAPYGFLWSNSDTSEDLTTIGAGMYTVIVTDANGCSANIGYTLTAPATIATDITSSTQPGGANITCSEGTDGSIATAITGGTLPYAITWNGPGGFTANTDAINNLGAGAYTLLVTDANGCGAMSVTTLAEPTPVVVNVTSVTYNGGFNIPCSNLAVGVFDANASGGTPGYTYLWSLPDGSNSTIPSLTGLTAGSYDLMVSDSNGCSASTSVTLTEPGPFDVVIQLSDFGGSSVSCAGDDGSIALSVSGGTPAYEFNWTGPDGFGSQQEDVSTLAGGSYDLVVSDANGCHTDTTIVLTAPQPLQALFSNSPNICAGGSNGAIDLQLTGGGAPYTFAWSGPGGTTYSDEDLAGVVSGTYTVQVSDGLGCNGLFTTVLQEPAPINSGTYVSFYGLYNLQCQGDSTGVIELAPMGGTAPFTLVMNGPGGYSTTSLANDHLVAGDYAITITDAAGCTLDTTVTLNEPNTVISAALTTSVYPSGTNVSCYGASDGWINATVLGGFGPYTFAWRGPDSLEFATEDVAGLPAGSYAYELVVIDANQCAFTTQVTLTQPDTSIYASSTVSQYNGGFNVSCPTATDGSIDLMPAGGNGGYTYVWTGPAGFTATTEDVSGLASGIYTAAITDINGCTYEQTITLSAPQPIVAALDAATFTGGSNISCNGASDGSITADVSGGAPGYTLAWSGPGGFNANTPMITGLAAGDYCLSILDANGCTGQQCITLTEPAALSAVATASNAACGQATGAVDLSVAGGSVPYTYAWSNSASSEDLNGIVPGPYSVTVTDANGCTATALATVIGSPGIQAAATLVQNLCNGTSEGAIDVNIGSGSAPFVFTWNTGANTEDLTGLTAGDYSVTISDANGCSFNNTWTITESTPIVPDASVYVHANGYNISSYQGSDGSITLNVSGGTSPYTYSWSNGSSSSDLSGLAAGSYTVTVTDANGCSTSLTFELTQPTDLVLPTGYTPNGDGANDAFVIQGLDIYPSNTFVVLNRWGNVVYDRLNYTNDWRGENSQNEELPNGTYFVILNVNNGERVIQSYVDLRR